MNVHGMTETHGSKPWITNISIVPHTLGILTANTPSSINTTQKTRNEKAFNKNRVTRNATKRNETSL